MTAGPGWLPAERAGRRVRRVTQSPILRCIAFITRSASASSTGVYEPLLIPSLARL
jgi:hypothetical protein